ncbi:hypothetical protein J6590_039148 [Homalodisca vitripennis]|nr:hypothetical protein J6590_039148 [Homalodisca vitripennis]
MFHEFVFFSPKGLQRKVKGFTFTASVIVKDMQWTLFDLGPVKPPPPGTPTTPDRQTNVRLPSELLTPKSIVVFLGPWATLVPNTKSVRHELTRRRERIVRRFREGPDGHAALAGNRVALASVLDQSGLRWNSLIMKIENDRSTFELGGDARLRSFTLRYCYHPIVVSYGDVISIKKIRRVGCLQDREALRAESVANCEAHINLSRGRLSVCLLDCLSVCLLSDIRLATPLMALDRLHLPRCLLG